MDYLKQFTIPFKGMLDGVHHYSFEVNEVFFERFPDSPIGVSDLVIDLITDKQGDIMSVDLIVKGTMKAPCDRCLAEIDLPIAGRYPIILKMGIGIAEDPDLYYLDPDEAEWNVASVLYEYSCLSIPYSRLIDCHKNSPLPCNQDVLSKLSTIDEMVEQNPIWDELKKLNLK